LDPMMKRGKIAFTWKDLRATLQPSASDSVGSAQDGAEVDVPLKLVIPHFMATATSPARQKKVDVDATIPDVFSKEDIAGKTAPEPAAPAAPAAEPAPQPRQRLRENRPLKSSQKFVNFPESAAPCLR
jgi:hypothetical protein